MPTKKQPQSDDGIKSLTVVGKTFIFNLFTTRPRRRIYVGTRRLNDTHLNQIKTLFCSHMIVEKHILNGIRISLIFNQITTKTRRHIFVKTWRQKNFHFQSNQTQNPTLYFGQNTTSKKLSFSTKSKLKPDVIFSSKHNVKKTFIFNQIKPKTRRYILVRIQRLKSFNFQPNQN